MVAVGVFPPADVLTDRQRLGGFLQDAGVAAVRRLLAG